MHLKTSTSVLLLILLVCIAHGISLFNNYNIDDELVIENNDRIAFALEDIPGIFTSHYISTETVKADYRPLTILMFAIEYNWFPDSPGFSHFLNILCFCLFIWSLYAFVFSISKSESFAFLVASIFACAPHTTEVVASIKNRDEILALLFMTLAALQTHKLLLDNKKIRLLTIAILTIASILFKSTALPFSLLYLLFLASYQFPLKKLASVFITQILSILIVAVFIAVVLKSPFRQGYFLEDPLAYSNNLLEQIGLALNTMLHYSAKMLLPLRFGFYYGYNQITVQSVFNLLPIVSFFFHLVLLVLAIWLALKKKYTISTPIFSYLMLLGLYSNFPIHYQGIAGDRVLFSLLFPFSILMALAIEWLNQKFNLKAAPAMTSYFWLCIIILFSAKTIAREMQWKDRITLFKADIPHLDKSAKAHFILGYQLRSMAKNSGTEQSSNTYSEEALQHLNQAIQIYPKYTQALETAGLILASDLLQYEKAIPYFEKALIADSSAWKSAYNLALCQIHLTLIVTQQLP